MIWWSLIVVCYATNLRDDINVWEEWGETVPVPIPVKINLTLDRYTKVQSITIDANSEFSVLREKLKSTFYPNLQVCQLFLKYAGKAVDLTRTLESYGIGNESNVQVKIYNLVPS
jgi:hypothetical protein